MIDARRGQVFDVLLEPFGAAHGPVGPDGRFDARAAAAAAGRRADRLKGSVRAVVLTREDTVEIDDIAKARNAERKVGGRRFVVNAMNPVPGEWNVAGVLYHADPQMAGAADVRFALLDGNGVSLQPLGESRGGGMGGWTGFHLEFRQGPDAGPPAKLRMTMAAETKEIEIPFEFKR